MKHYRAVFISDTHLGMREALNTSHLLKFLQETSMDSLYLVGDIIDFRALQRRVYWSDTEMEIVQRILQLAKGGTHVYYITGNHDEILRPLLAHEHEVSLYDGITLCNRAFYSDDLGNQFLVVHGDFHDGIERYHPTLSKLGSSLYALMLRINRFTNWIQKKAGVNEPKSFSKYMKRLTKNVIQFASSYQESLAKEADEYGCDGVICGHIHRPEHSVNANGFIYFNCGDWVENMTVIVQTEGSGLRVLDCKNK